MFKVTCQTIQPGCNNMRSEPNLTRIESLEKKHYDGILKIVENLPEWFDETARRTAHIKKA